MRNTITACAVAVLLAACGSTPEDRYQSARRACQIANVGVAIAEEAARQNPANGSFALALVAARAAAAEACQIAADLKPAGIEALATADPLGGATDECIEEAAVLPEEQWEDAARACVAP